MQVPAVSIVTVVPMTEHTLPVVDEYAIGLPELGVALVASGKIGNVSLRTKVWLACAPNVIA